MQWRGKEDQGESRDRVGLGLLETDILVSMCKVLIVDMVNKGDVCGICYSTWYIVLFILVAEWHADLKDCDILCPWIHLSLSDRPWF